MALVFASRVQETSTTTGTGTLDLGGASDRRQTFVAGIGDGNKCLYGTEHPSQDEWEHGIGTVTDASPDTLARTHVVESSNAGALVNFSAGTKDVWVCNLPSTMLSSGHKSGGNHSNGTDADHDIDFEPLAWRDAEDELDIRSTSTITKRLDAAWSAGDAAGGRDTGSIASSTWYYPWAITKPDGTSDFLFSTSKTSPTMPSGYTHKVRLYGGFLTDGSSNITAYEQNGNVTLWRDGSVENLDTSSPATAYTALALTVPPVAGLRPIFKVQLSNSSTGRGGSFASGNQADPSSHVVRIYQNLVDNVIYPPIDVLSVDSSGQIKYLSNNATGWTNFIVETIGWIDPRGSV